jgi:hypothetical protein
MRALLLMLKRLKAVACGCLKNRNQVQFKADPCRQRNDS